MVTEGNVTTAVTIKGFNLERRSRVLFKGVAVPYKAVSNGTSNKAHLIVRFRD
jgi:hypothetical protein